MPGDIGEAVGHVLDERRESVDAVKAMPSADARDEPALGMTTLCLGMAALGLTAPTEKPMDWAKEDITVAARDEANVEPNVMHDDCSKPIVPSIINSSL
jgi:hypothetical protein